MKKHIAISTFIILLSISTALPSHALADTGQTRSDIRPAETTDNTSAYDRITTAEIILASMFAISSAGCISLYRRKNTAPDNRPDTATHTTVTSPADDTPPDADTADTVSNGSGLTTTPSEQTVPTELLHKIIDFGLAHSDSHQKISDNLRALTKESRHTDAHARESFRLLNSQTEIFQQLFDTAFLCTYPRFVDRLNSLLLPEKTFPHPTPGQLTPELRVAAFMRIGVDDCNRIARTLGLSLNTVYTYRNRTRQRAADRNRFMAELMKIS
ncbi:hypothetical protein EEL36_00885 [Muribaculaceae bacterium Isolate-043 (Harlan)]|nr:hypothetical protein EEL36_00885 [Muribaculaceae bacterium Isolate-043 (Harlan)]